MPDEDNCACGIKYKTGGQLVAVLQMFLGLSLLIAGVVTTNYDCYLYDENPEEYLACLNANGVSWCVAVGGSFCVAAACFLLHGVQMMRPSGLWRYMAIAVICAINYLIAAVLAICYGINSIYTTLFFAVAIWTCFTVVFVYKYGKIMTMQLPRARVMIFATPYVSRGDSPGAPAQVVIDPGVQPGVYPAPYNPAPPGVYPGNMNPSYPYPSDFSQPPPYSTTASPPPYEPQRADALPPKSSTDTPTNSS